MAPQHSSPPSTGFATIRKVLSDVRGVIGLEQALLGGPLPGDVDIGQPAASYNVELAEIQRGALTRAAKLANWRYPLSSPSDSQFGATADLGLVDSQWVFVGINAGKLASATVAALSRYPEER